MALHTQKFKFSVKIKFSVYREQILDSEWNLKLGEIIILYFNLLIASLTFDLLLLTNPLTRLPFNETTPTVLDPFVNISSASLPTYFFSLDIFFFVVPGLFDAYIRNTTSWFLFLPTKRKKDTCTGFLWHFRYWID